MDDENGQDEPDGGQSQHNDAKHTGKGGDRVDAVDETEVGEHVEEEGAETLDVSEGRFDFAEGHFCRIDQPLGLHFVLNVRLRHQAERHLSEPKPPDARGRHGEWNHPSLTGEAHHKRKVDHQQQPASEVARGKRFV